MLLPFGSGVQRGDCCFASKSLGAPENSPLYYFNNRFPFSTPQPHFLGAGSLILLLLFKSNTSDYGVLPVHSAAKIRHKTQRRLRVWAGRKLIKKKQRKKKWKEGEHAKINKLKKGLTQNIIWSTWFVSLCVYVCMRVHARRLLSKMKRNGANATRLVGSVWCLYCLF